MKKVNFVLLIILLTIVFIAVACTQEEEVSALDYSSFGAEEGLDFDGFEMRYTIVPDPYGYGEADAPFGYLLNSAFSDAAMERVRTLEQNLNFKMTFAYTIESTLEQQSIGATMANSYYTDACDVEDGGIKGMTIALVPISDLSEQIDMYNFDKWGSPEILETVMVKGVLYAVRAEMWPERFASFAAPIIFNANLIRMIGQPDPREFIESNSWNRETMAELIRQCTVYEGSEVKYYGMGATSTYMFELGVRTNGAFYMEKSGDGYVYALDSEKAMRGMQWVFDMISENRDCFYNGAVGASRETYLNPFIDGKTAMFMHPTWALFTLVGTKVESWGLLPFPMGPDNETGDWVGFLAGNRNFVGILHTSRDPEATAIILNELYEPLEDYPDKESLIEYYSNYMFHDPRDAEIFFAMQEGSRFNYWYEGGSTVCDTISTSLTSKTIMQVVTERAAAYQSLIDNYAGPNQELYEMLKAGK